MEIIIILIGISIVIAGTFLAIFYWSMKSGQYDDVYTPSVRMLFDDKPAATKENGNVKASSSRDEKSRKPTVLD